MMPYLADCYILINSRKQAIVLEFLKKYLPGKAIQSAESYKIPIYSDCPIKIFYNAYKFMVYLENKPEINYSIYFYSENKELSEQASVHYTKDGCMILCSAVPAEKNLADNRLKELKLDFNADYGYIAYEQPPPMTSNELAEEYVFKPLNMKHSSLIWSDCMIPDIAVGHNNKSEPLEKYKPETANAASGLHINLKDYMKFINAIVFNKKETFSKEILNQIYNPAVYLDNETAWTLFLGMKICMFFSSYNKIIHIEADKNIILFILY